MEKCSCEYCYHEVCFHPSRGDGQGLGVPCDGCEFDAEALTEGGPEVALADTIQL